ncbi:PIG-L family deacetylase [Saccharomonospora sp. NB11]|uniref:PIG-L family deacetylase n=1 Tax=Saccharomonospora sp. NB11 TaxID=1642298 RepID=UPI0018D066D2|nr:PIG-L family deacetylase [Saccharomonospora sp. NB11]
MPHVVYYVAGHPDDVLLFKGELLHGDLHWPDVKVVGVVVTAGDAGRLDDWWWAREHGLVDAFRVSTGEQFEADPVTVNGREVMRYRAGRWGCYFLRLPDGNVDGSGFPATGHRSLARLRDGEIDGLDSLPTRALPSQHYASWADVVSTLRAVLALERGGATNAHPWVNASDHDRGLNPGDHPDHYATADALTEFVAADGYSRAWWVSYDSENRPPNLSGTALAAKRRLYRDGYVALVDRIMGSPPPGADAEWDRWGARDYWREEAAE